MNRTKHNSNSYDAIIIGAGIGGLVCGCYLAKAGMKVLIAEQHSKPGGYCTSFRRNGFQFDAAAHSFGSYRKEGHIRNILLDLDIEDMLIINRFDPSDIVISPDFRISFQNNMNNTISDLSSTFPQERDNIINFFNYISNIKRNQFIKLRNKTFDYVLKSFFKDGNLINALSLPILGNGGLPPSLIHAFTGLWIFAEFMSDGGYYPEGGIQKLPDAFSYTIRQNNGDITYGKAVKEISCKNNQVLGVKLDNDEFISSKYVISACDITQTYKKLLGTEQISEDIINKISNMIPSLSFFILYIGIDKPFSSLPPAGTNFWYLPYYDADKIYFHLTKCDIKKAGMFLLRLSPDSKTMSAFINVPFMTSSFWKENKKQFSNDFLCIIENAIPHLKKHITYLSAATPSTLQRYTLNYKGSAYGWAYTTDQVFDYDLSHKCHVEGLYHTGHWTTQVQGIPGVAYLGKNIAQKILKREKIM